MKFTSHQFRLSRSRVRQYVCPGQHGRPISQAVHLQRLDSGYRLCRNCPNRDDLRLLSTTAQERLARLRKGEIVRFLPDLSQEELRRFVDYDTIRAEAINQIDPQAVRQFAIATGLWLRDRLRDQPREQSGDHSCDPCQNDRQEPEFDAPSVLIAGDCRAETWEYLSASTAGLKFAGCQLTDAGLGSLAYARFVADQIRADALLYIGRPEMSRRIVGFTLHTRANYLNLADSETISAVDRETANQSLHQTPKTENQAPKTNPPELVPLPESVICDELLARMAAVSEASRPVRRVAKIVQLDCTDEYLASYQATYHALRPIRFVLASTDRSVRNYLQQLLATSAVELTDQSLAEVEPLRATVLEKSAHFGAIVTRDGAHLVILDNRGQALTADQLNRLLADPGPEFGNAMSVQPVETPDGPALRCDSLLVISRLLAQLSRSDLHLSERLDEPTGMD